jgi:hypothetical protein
VSLRRRIEELLAEWDDVSLRRRIEELFVEWERFFLEPPPPAALGK